MFFRVHRLYLSHTPCKSYTQAMCCLVLMACGGGRVSATQLTSSSLFTTHDLGVAAFIYAACIFNRNPTKQQTLTSNTQKHHLWFSVKKFFHNMHTTPA